MFKSGQGAGKSGSFFFYSFDNKFLIKTISQAEKNLFLSMLGDYIDHISKKNQPTLVTCTYIRDVYDPDILVWRIITNYNAERLPVSQKQFQNDLWLERKHSQSEYTLWFQILERETKVMKDINFLEINNDI